MPEKGVQVVQTVKTKIKKHQDRQNNFITCLRYIIIQTMLVYMRCLKIYKS